MSNIVTFEEATFAAEADGRTLTGILLPFGKVSGPARDPISGKVARFTFTEDTITLPDPSEVPIVLNYGHDTQSLKAQIGIATALSIEPGVGVLVTFRIARTPEGDRVLALAEDKILRSFSAEVAGEFTPGKDGVMHSKATTLTGGAVVKTPAFTDAAITNVAASAALNGKDVAMGDENPNDATATFSKAEGDQLMAKVESMATELAALKDVKIPVGPGVQQFEVREEPIYRFGGSEGAPSGFDFATDLLAAGKDRDGAALKRLQEFTAERLSPDFVTTGNVSQVNSSQYRPDMFLGQAPVPASPLYDFFHKGSLSNVTPFFWSKLDRAATTVGTADHVEGTDPTATNLVTATGTTVTPVPVSGKVHITREVADQGGNPVISGLVWSEFERSFKISLETKTAAIITAGLASITALATIATGTSGINAGAAVEAGLVDLQFLADGFRFEKAFGHVDLYKALAGATLTTGEKVYPIINPGNRDGQTAEKFAYMDIAGYRVSPVASLGVAGGTKNSIVADHTAVHVWNSGLTRLDKVQEKVEGWDMGVFGYFAGVLYDATGIRKITYTP